MKKNNRVMGVIGVAAYNANWNADMEGNPRSNNGRFEASNNALKYVIRNLWKMKNMPVFYTKSMSHVKNDMSFNTLKDRYETFFNTKLDKNCTRIEVLKNLFKCLDVMNFGAAFPEADKNLSLNGVTQFSEGINVYDDSQMIRVGVLSPFVNSNQEDSKQTTMGSRVFTDEAHYLYSLTVNPTNYDEYIGIVDGFEGYQEEDYQALKNTSLHAVDMYNSVSKAGCENEFALFVELKDGSLKLIPNLHQLISFSKTEDKGEFDLTKVYEALSDISNDIDNIEVYINPSKCVIYPNNKELPIKAFNIRNKREIS